MPYQQLQKAWREMSVEGVPTVPTQILRQLVAQRIQEKRYGGLKASVRRELEKLAIEARDGSAGPTKPRAPSLSPGTRLVREWNTYSEGTESISLGFDRHQVLADVGARF